WVKEGVATERSDGQGRKLPSRQYATAPSAPNIPEFLATRISEWARVDGPFQSPPLADAPSIALAAEKRSGLLSVDEFGMLVPRRLERAQLKQNREKYVASRHTQERQPGQPSQWCSFSPLQPDTVSVASPAACDEGGVLPMPLGLVTRLGCSPLGGTQRAAALFRSFDGKHRAPVTLLQASHNCIAL
ncbi:hypothetical protein LTR53_003554, partial [Teratosphaeriaceae sp. CCFEE 6253]